MKLNLISSNTMASNLLDLSRFVLAVMVVCYHGGLDFIPGYEAVMVFFVLSGYFISSSVYKLINNNKWSWKTYFINRITRLWVVLIPALFLSVFWGLFQVYLFNKVEVLETLETGTFIGNLFFLQGILFENYGLNGPLWSLSYEFWYYILFPCLVLVIYTPKKINKVLYLLIVIGLSIFLGQKIMMYFFVWCLGAIIPFITPLKSNIKVKSIIFIIASLIAIISINLFYFIYHTNHAEPKYVIDLLVGISFALWIYTLISVFDNKTLRSKSSYYFKYFAGMSYTLYLVHYPIMLFIMELLYGELNISKSSPIIAFVLKPVTFLVIFGYAWLISRVTEAKTDKVKNLILKWFKKKENFVKAA
jgi:peptidoglycan/LPS O-acetylase OafA/YrhL